MRQNISSHFFTNNNQISKASQNWNSTCYLRDNTDNLFTLVPNTKIEDFINQSSPNYTNNEEHVIIDQPTDFSSPASSISIHSHSPIPRILSPASSISNENSHFYSFTHLYSVTKSPLVKQPSLFSEQINKFQLNDLNIKKKIGSGNYAQVYLAENTIDKRHYAIKAIDKKLIVSEKQTRHAHDEKSILTTVDHPFLVKLWGTFQTNKHLCLVTDYVTGGELFRVMQKKKKLSEQEAKFYTAEIILALEYLHSLNIVYRDLKPENIILDAAGHIKLVDFGLAKVVKDTTFTLCGTPDYLAPEIIRARGYTGAVDWWSLGVLIYEMLVGFTPFIAETPLELYENILLCDVNWLDDISPDAKNLIQGLLQPKPKDRYNLKDIKSHSWFSNIDFDELLKCNIKPPFIPEKVDITSTCDQETKQIFDIYQEHEVYDDRFSSF
ncbi:hypothetical protein G6F57_001974 [Rhizopus arrhizus]|nr:hypothetical protein G6F30_004304 [Rhizopus arrhizus]KAG1425616.1 hypothetical protein G6F58_001838 [Rhizopus delemar]KAG0986221.1 hypothetical protein G6F29_003424 [Rhizopus arrhizus]KAG0996334.1 hypothetical protein G6F28_003943 [Rhizopus arrhizus]KAG1011225.1 hypothetical protein G6F27_003937 [Rhizopus arrhizus]